MKSTKKAYEEFLNGLPMNEDEFIMGGKFRERYCNVGKYGTVYENMIRVHLKLDIENGKKKINILDIFGKESIIKVCEAFNVQFIPLN